MIVVLSDTHGKSGHRLAGRALEAVEQAEMVIHAGDFDRGPVLDTFHDVTDDLVAVYGNSDDDTIRRRLPKSQTVTAAGITISVVHRARNGEQALELFGRERGANLVVSGHTHVAKYHWTGALGLLNPGSHAQPRGNDPTHAELTPTDDGLEGVITHRDGTVLERFELTSELG